MEKQTNIQEEPTKIMGISSLSVNQKSTLSIAGLTNDEIKIIEAWRYIEFGKIVCYKKANTLSGRIDIQTTY